MSRTNFTEDRLKQALKEALSETLQEQRELLNEVFSQALEDFTPAEAIREGRKTSRATRGGVFRILRGDA